MLLRFLVLSTFVLLMADFVDAQSGRRPGRGLSGSGMRNRASGNNRTGRNTLEIPVSKNVNFRSLSRHEIAAEKQKQTELAHRDLVKAIKEGRIDPTVDSRQGRGSSRGQDSRERALEARRLEREERALMREEMANERKMRRRSRKGGKEEDEEELSRPSRSKRARRKVEEKQDEPPKAELKSEEKQ